MDFENIITLIKAVSDSHLTSFEYEENGTKIRMKTDKKSTVISSTTGAVVPQVVVAEAAPVAVQTAAEEKPVEELTGNIVKSPLVGTFYSAPSPDEAPFVQVGDHVKKGQVLGIVEAMKLMNEIESDYDGVVKQILVTDASVVEYDQPMFVIE
ncbi:MAG: acetyl-CoA carboxylase biotin carboxyl carrier protein [Lachnospiraceae bacterium]